MGPWSNILPAAQCDSIAEQSPKHARVPVIHKTATLQRTDTRERRLVHGFVSRLVPFCQTSPLEIATLEKYCWTLPAQTGVVIARRGEHLPGVLAVAYGFIKLVLQGTRQEGRILQVAAAGQMFGESSALLGRPVPYDAVAMNDCKLVVIPATGILSLIDRDPRFARSMVRILAERNFEYLNEVESATTKRAAQRLASYLNTLVPANGPPGTCTVRLPVSKSVVAARLGLKKETLSRLFHKFASDGLITVSRRDIDILNVERLSEMAD